MSNLNISDLSFLDDIELTNNQVLKNPSATEVYGGQSVIENTSQQIGETLLSLGFPDLAEQAFKGPERVAARLDNVPVPVSFL